MKKLLLLLVVPFIFVTCSKNNLNEDLSLLNNQGDGHKASNQVAVCHKSGDTWHVINISINAWPAHEAHGDAVDMDGDGYFDRECGCSEVDCDDNDPDVNLDCGENSVEAPLVVVNGDETLYVYPEDNSAGTRGDAAAAVCESLDALGYNDWYLPAKEELNAVYMQLEEGEMSGKYWSSTTQGIFDMWYQDFDSGTQTLGTIFESYKCRCVRKDP